MMKIYRLGWIPEKTEYVAALQSLYVQGKVSKLQRAILTAQYEAPGHTAGATELGKLLGYHLAVINGQYGRLGHLIADELDFVPDRREIGTYRWWAVLAEGWYDETRSFIWRMHETVALALEELGWVEREARFFPEEVAVPEKDLFEGAIRKVAVNAYERSAVARNQCIAYYGAKCAVCGFDFESTYGPLGSGYIHVHHLTPLSEIGESYTVDPKTDLRPVCPNCHAMIHRTDPPLEIDQVRDLISSQRRAQPCITDTN